jgi:hypothetical protein
MRDPNRIEPILGLIREIWYTYPDLRLTQLIMNVLNINQDPYYIEDEYLEAALKDYKKLMEENN